MNDIISIISLLSIYIFGLAVIAYTFADTGRTANQRKYEKKLKEAILYEEFKNNDIYLLVRIPLYSITDWHRSPISDSHPFDQPGT